MSRFTCTKCKAASKCQGPIAPELVGEHNGSVDLLILGEAPGKEEEMQGRPFIGRSGELLRNTLKSITENYVLVNSRCCYAAHKPKPTELESCKKHWIKAVLKYNPKLIVALGDYAHTALTNRKQKMKEVVGALGNFKYKNLNYMFLTNYHPAYLLRMSGSETKTSVKAENVWADIWDKASDFIEKGLPEFPKIRLLLEADDVCDYLQRLQKEYIGNYAYDYETWGDVSALRPELCNEFQILCVGLSTDIETVAFPFSEQIKNSWQMYISTSLGQAIAQNSKYEHKCNLKVYGQSYPLTDTMLQMNLIDESAEANLNAIGSYCEIPWTWYKKQMQTIQKEPQKAQLKDLLRYCGLDALLTKTAHDLLQPKVIEQGLVDVLQLMGNVAENLAKVEMTGMAIDALTMSEVEPELKEQAKTAKEKFRGYKAVKKSEAWAAENISTWEKGKKEFNPKSHPQMLHLCLDELGLSIEADYQGNYSLGKDVLVKYEDRFPVIKSLLEYRSTESILKNFVSKWKDYTGPDNCIHTTYNLDVARTGRLSSSEINLQNIPKDNIVRKAFVSRYENGLLLSSDYVQLEVMILAGLSGERELKKAFAENLDLHLYVSSLIYGLDYEELLALYISRDEDAKKKRFMGKQMNLGTMYGLTKYGMSDKTGISIDAAEELINKYNQKFPGVYEYRTDLCKQAMRNGYVTDLFGRRRHLPNARSSDKYKQNRSLRQAGNAPVQSTGNSFCLLSLCLVRELFRERNIRAVLINTEHDKLQIDMDADWRREVIQTVSEAMLIHNEMNYWQPCGVELKVDMSVGKNLYEMESI